MSKPNLYDRFISEYPGFKPLVKSWRKNGKYSIMIYTTTGKRMIFKVGSDNTPSLISV